MEVNVTKNFYHISSCSGRAGIEVNWCLDLSFCCLLCHLLTVAGFFYLLRWGTRLTGCEVKMLYMLEEAEPAS